MKQSLASWGSVLAIVAASGVAAAQAPPTPKCDQAEHRQFDFWVGEWDVTMPDGKPAGHSRIERILDGCVLQENWTGASGFSGKSFNLYNRDTRHWEQFWVDQSGSRLHLVGGLRDSRMVLIGIDDPAPASAPTTSAKQQRITWTPNADGSVRQLWETSADGGRQWSVSFDGLYKRAADQ